MSIQALPAIDTSERLIHGSLLKCVDGRWSTQDDPDMTGTQLLALTTTRAIQRWQLKEPVDTVVDTGAGLPDIDELNAKIPRDRMGAGPRRPAAAAVAAPVCRLSARYLRRLDLHLRQRDDRRAHCLGAAGRSRQLDAGVARHRGVPAGHARQPSDEDARSAPSCGPSSRSPIGAISAAPAPLRSTAHRRARSRARQRRRRQAGEDADDGRNARRRHSVLSRCCHARAGPRPVRNLCRRAVPARRRQGFVAVRSFYEDADKPFRLSTANLSGGLRFLIDVAEDDARRAAQNPKPGRVLPAARGLRQQGPRPRAGPARRSGAQRRMRRASAARRARCSKTCSAPQPLSSKRRHAGSTAATPEDKLHVHWRLKQPATGKALDRAQAGSRSRGPARRRRSVQQTGLSSDPLAGLVAPEGRTAAVRDRARRPRSRDRPRGGAGGVAGGGTAGAGSEIRRHHGSGDSSDWYTLVNGIISGASYHASLVVAGGASGRQQACTTAQRSSCCARSCRPRRRRTTRCGGRRVTTPSRRIVSSAREKYQRRCTAVRPVAVHRHGQPGTASAPRRGRGR